MVRTLLIWTETWIYDSTISRPSLLETATFLFWNFSICGWCRKFMLASLWGKDAAHICTELPACCVWFFWKHSWNENIKHPDKPFPQQQAVILESEVGPGAADCCLSLPPDLHDSLSCTGPLLHSAYQSSISAARIREGEPICNFWIYAGLHAPSLRFWARAGRGRSQQVKHRSTRGWSKVNCPKSSAVFVPLSTQQKCH